MVNMERKEEMYRHFGKEEVDFIVDLLKDVDEPIAVDPSNFNVLMQKESIVSFPVRLIPWFNVFTYITGKTPKIYLNNGLGVGTGRYMIFVEDYWDIPLQYVLSCDECKKNPRKDTFVYFITEGRYVKIGVSNSIESRIKSIQTGNPNVVSCVTKWKCKGHPYKLEKKLHKYYESHMIRGEWFDILDKVEEFKHVCKILDTE